VSGVIGPVLGGQSSFVDKKLQEFFDSVNPVSPALKTYLQTSFTGGPTRGIKRMSTDFLGSKHEGSTGAQAKIDAWQERMPFPLLGAFHPVAAEKQHDGGNDSE
jgi:hypothetical protein